MAKRFYQTVTVAPAVDGFVVQLDNQSVLSPGKRALALPGEALAQAIAAEWKSQGQDIDPSTMPLTRLANTTLDTVMGNRAEVAGEIAKYAETDLVCYRVLQPEALRQRQADAWDPLVLWVGQAYGVGLVVTSGLLPAAQPPEALAAVRPAVDGFGEFGLAALHAATTALGSVVIALAMAAGRITAADAWRFSLVEELYQTERWGDDRDAEARRTKLRADLAAAHQFLLLCG